MVLATWTLVLLYETVYFNSLFEKQTWIKILRILLGTAISVILYFILLNVITKIRVGQAIKIFDILSSQTLFASIGYYMLKMPLWHPWLLLVALYAFALAKSLSATKILTKETDVEEFHKNKILFTLAVLGMGIFSYYEGRSYWTVFLSVIYPGIILLGILLDEMIRKIDNKNNLQISYHLFLIPAGLFLLTVMAASGIYYFINNPNVKVFLNKEYLSKPIYMEEEMQTIKQIKENIENIQLILPFESYYYTNLDLKDTKKFPAYIDLFTYDDIEKICNEILENKSSWCIKADIYDVLQRRYSEKLQQAIKQNYVVYKIGQDILLVENNCLEKANNIEGLQKIEL